MSTGRDTKGRFVPGNKVTRKGSPNRTKKSLEEKVFLLVEGNISQVQRDLKMLDPKERVKAITDLMKYVLPAKRAVDANLNFETLLDLSSDEVIDRILEEIFIRQKNHAEGIQNPNH